jgi:Cu(I)-responsive transcriptional regulator
MDGLTIGKLAKRSGLGIETVRFYERQGLIAPPPRTSSNYRIYPPGDIDRLRFIKRAKTLGFSLREIRELLFLREEPTATKADVKRRTEEKIAEIGERIRDLTRIKEALEGLAASCDGEGPTSQCPILQSIAGDDQGASCQEGGTHHEKAYHSKHC